MEHNQLKDIHNQLRRDRGLPSNYTCGWRLCEDQGDEWAMDHRKPGNLFRLYSEDPNDYVALCGSHHERLDAWARRERLWQEARCLALPNPRLVEVLDRMHTFVHSNRDYKNLRYRFSKSDLEALIFKQH